MNLAPSKEQILRCAKVKKRVEEEEEKKKKNRDVTQKYEERTREIRREGSEERGMNEEALEGHRGHH